MTCGGDDDTGDICRQGKLRKSFESDIDKNIRIREVSLTSVVERVPREGIARLVPRCQVGIRIGVHVPIKRSVSSGDDN